MTQITIAMAKGRLAEQTMELMEALGIDGEYRVDLDKEDLFPPVEPPRGA